MTMRKLVVAVFCLALAAPLFAADPMVTYKSGKDDVVGFLVTPEGKGPFPGIVVIQEWWGLNDWVKDQARALAKEGYVALAPDLYRGKVADKQEDAHQLMMGAPGDRVLRDLRAAYATLQGRADVSKSRVGVIGWCF